MKVILLQNVPKVGKKYEVVDVAPGYARNFLIARGLCEAVTRTNVARIAEFEKRRAVEAAKEAARIEKAVASLTNTSIDFEREVNDEGHLYAQVSAHDIAKAIEEKIQVALPVNHIHISKQIKEVGDHKVNVTVGDKDVEITVSVKALN